jgi:hypothetical protein
MLKQAGALVIATAFVSAASAQQVTIDFGGLSGSEGDSVGTYTEDGYTLVEIPFTLDQGFSNGNPPPSIYTQSITGLGDFTEGTTGLFTFNGFDGWSDDSQFFDAQVTAIGWLEGATVYSEGFLMTDNTWSTFVSANSDVVIDRLQISLVINDASTLAVDNFVFTTVPAPGALALLAGAGLVSVRRRR